MKKKILTIKRLLICCLFISTYINTNISASDISRGHQSGELFFASCWYYLDIGERYHVICYSDDYGQSLSFKYICNIDLEEMVPLNLLSDIDDGIFYNYMSGTPPGIYISYDHCKSWQQCQGGLNFISVNYSAGNEAGIIYSRYTGSDELFKSLDYASSFEVIKEDSVYGFLEVGTEEGEIYHAFGPTLYDNFNIYFSNDGGQSFLFINEYDSITGGVSLYGHYPRIFHGTLPGELYLVSWHWPANFKIYFSADYGANFEFRYVSPFCDFNWEKYKFTPGIDQGSFYYVKEIDWYDGINTLVNIYFSDDTAKTFTEHVHVLDTTFPVRVPSYYLNLENEVSFNNYPNPFHDKTIIRLNNPGNDIYYIELRDLSGKIVLERAELISEGNKDIALSTADIPPGLYLCSVACHDKILGTIKIVKGN